MKTNKEFIDGIYEKVDEISKEKTENKQRNINKIINIAAILVIVFNSISNKFLAVLLLEPNILIVLK